MRSIEREGPVIGKDRPGGPSSFDLHQFLIAYNNAEIDLYFFRIIIAFTFVIVLYRETIGSHFFDPVVKSAFTTAKLLCQLYGGTCAFRPDQAVDPVQERYFFK